MGKTNQLSKLTTGDKFDEAFRRAYGALYQSIFRFDTGKEVRCDSVSLRLRGDGWLALARGYSFSRGCEVVAFGSGFDYLTAVRNLNAAIARSDWRQDKYAGSHTPSLPKD